MIDIEKLRKEEKIRLQKLRNEKIKRLYER